MSGLAGIDHERNLCVNELDESVTVATPCLPFARFGRADGCQLSDQSLFRNRARRYAGPASGTSGQPSADLDRLPSSDARRPVQTSWPSRATGVWTMPSANHGKRLISLGSALR